MDVDGAELRQLVERIQQVLRQLIESHLAYTGSAVAQRILDNWVAMLPKFKKVMPVEYARALAEMAKAQAADTTGFDVLEIGVGQSKRN